MSRPAAATKPASIPASVPKFDKKTAVVTYDRESTARVRESTARVKRHQPPFKDPASHTKRTVQTAIVKALKTIVEALKTTVKLFLKLDNAIIRLQKKEMSTQVVIFHLKTNIMSKSKN